MKFDWTLLIGVGGILLFQIAIFSSLPNRLRDILAGQVFFGVSFVYTLSAIILVLCFGQNILLGLFCTSAIVFFVPILYGYKKAADIRETIIVFERSRLPRIKVIYNDGSSK